MGKEFLFLIKSKGTEDSSAWREPMEVPDTADPTEYGLSIVQGFNEEEDELASTKKGYKPQYREFVKALDSTGREFCEFFKVNGATVVRGMQNYDIYKCKKCGMYHQQFGMIGRPTSVLCTPELLCRECNRLFKTVKALEKHMQNKKHKIPSWLPDGV